jgi:mRNA-degrading endonuclease RelE of RelBE toxin-antitoxin system
MGDVLHTLEFDEEWDFYFKKLDKSVRERILKKIEKLKTDWNIGSFSRHLRHGAPYPVQEIGKYRLCFRLKDKEKVIRIYFADDHKDYEKWIGLR